MQVLLVFKNVIFDFSADFWVTKLKLILVKQGKKI